MSRMASRQQAGASCSCSVLGLQVKCFPSALLHQRRYNHKHNVVIFASSNSSGMAESFARDARSAASRVFKQAKTKWEAFAKDQRFEQRANDAFIQASTSAQEAADMARDKARRVFVELDSQYELTSKTAQASRRAQEAARDVDQRYGVRRRVRSATDYIRRSWPAWQRQLNELAATWYGKATLCVALCLLVSSPIFWSVLNVLLLLWWLSVPVAMLLLNLARERQAQRLQQQQAEAEAATRRATNPFADLFGGSFSTRGAGRRAGAANSRSQHAAQDGPIIDAEWTSIDKGDQTRGTKSSGTYRGRKRS